MTISLWGWTPEREAELDSLPLDDTGNDIGSDGNGRVAVGVALEPARVIRVDRDRCRIVTAAGPRDATVTGRFRHRATTAAEFPAVGDWVAITRTNGVRPNDTAQIHRVLPRATTLSRLRAGPGVEDEQVMAANVDLALITTGLDRDFNLHRLERLLFLCREREIDPVVVLTKTDLCDDVPARVELVERLVDSARILPVCAITGAGVTRVRDVIHEGQTAVVLGSSGVGKSTLINALFDDDSSSGNGNNGDGDDKGNDDAVEQLPVGRTRHGDGKGRHTTSWREMVRIPTGGLLIDTPGMREVGLWADRPLSAGSFEDLEQYAAACRFRDCEHDDEPGCAVAEAIELGWLEVDRLAQYITFKRELAYLARKQDARARKEEAQRWKRVTKSMRQRNKHRHDH